MEIVSTLLGHSKIQTSQEHYEQIVQKKVSLVNREFNTKLDVKFS